MLSQPHKTNYRSPALSRSPDCNLQDRRARGNPIRKATSHVQNVYNVKGNHNLPIVLLVSQSLGEQRKTKGHRIE